MKYIKNNQSGMILTIALLLGASFIVISLAVIQFSVQHYITARRGLAQVDALDLAEAGADNFMYHLNQDSSYSGTNTSCPISTSGSNPVILYNDSVKGKGTYETCYQAGSISNEKIVYSVGKIYLPAGSASPLSTRTVKLIVEGSQPANYAVQTGPGGIIIGNNVLIGLGDIYTNGFITMGNNSTMGTIVTPVNVWAANYQCPAGNPPGSSYPALCGSGEPISMNNGTHIYGNVRANGQVNPGCCASKMSGPGLTATSGVGPTTLPDPGRAAMKANATNTMTAANASSCSGSYKTWTNVHITGNVNLPNNCTITVGGDVWIDGSLTAGNNNVFAVLASLSSSPQLAIDGSGGFDMGNNPVLASNILGTGFRVVTYWNSTGNPDAASLTGDNLYNSMFISNNRSNPHYTIKTGSNASAAVGSTLYAVWSGVQLNNNGTVGSIIGQIIDLNNNGTISFNGLGSGGASTWDVRYYEQL